VLRAIFGPRKGKVMEEWRKLHYEEHRDLYSSPSIMRMIELRKMRWPRHVARIGRKRNTYSLAVGKPERKKPLERPRQVGG
jgi:hypothetical protein